MKKILSVFLAISLCVGFAVPALAANPGNIVFTATLDNDKLTVSESDQTVILTVGTASDLIFDSAEYYISAEDAAGNNAEFTYAAISSTIGSGESAIAFGPAKTGAKNGKFFVSFYSADAENITGDFLGSFTVTIPANTPAGTYTINVTGIKTFVDYGEDYETGTSASATLTISEPVAEGYTVGLSASPASVQAGGTVDVTLNVTGTESTFNAFYAQLSYDSNFVLVEETYANNFDVRKAMGSNVLTITRTGSDLTATSTGTALTLHFTAADVTSPTEVSSAFTLTTPKVDKKANADLQDAPEAAITGSPVAVTINPIVTYTVTYDANGATGGTAPTDSTSYAANAVVTVLGNTGSLEKTGHTFNGWNTAAGGTGTSYAVGATFTITENTTLYAQWTAKTYNVTLHDNGADSCDTLTSYTYGVGATLPIPTKANYTFDGWYEDSGFSGTAVTAISTTDIDDKVFYAKWTATATVTVSAYCDYYTLIKVAGTPEAGKTFAYNGNAMYSDENGDYYYVVAGTFGTDITEIDAKAEVTQIPGSSATLAIDRDGDANQTGTVDINDAQFIYNVRTGYYITNNIAVSVDKLLEADVNGDGEADALDIAAAVAAIK